MEMNYFQLLKSIYPRTIVFHQMKRIKWVRAATEKKEKACDGRTETGPF